MTRRNPPAKWILPDVVDPPERVCFQIMVPNNLYHIAAFRGALYNLTSARFWQDDEAHTAKDVAQVWQQIYNNVRTCPDCDSDNIGITLEDLMSQQIRLKPDDSCVIQMWCIDEWVDWYDPRTCVAGTIEQPTDGDDIGAGECRQWSVSLRGNDKWLLPAVVNEGDTIEITGASGAWNDGTLAWNCVNGQTFALGICSGQDLANPGDPLQGANHMALIASVDGTWFNAYNTIITVPTGVTDGQVFFQANDSNLNDNAGTVAFTVKLCRASEVLSTIGITYQYGSGPATLSPTQQTQWIISVNSSQDPYGQAIRMTFSEPVKITYLQAINWNLDDSSPGAEFSRIQNAGNPVQILYTQQENSPVDHTPGLTGDNIQTDTGFGGAATAWTAQLKIERV